MSIVLEAKALDLLATGSDLLYILFKIMKMYYNVEEKKFPFENSLLHVSSCKGVV